ncbi:TRAP-type C4-dicarboxylate transport system, small permease component [Pasteurella testudinis DSM 23072]|uniref:TRAP transporter small permease protein n=1 Tax=Pasteurella testudinis DSM 23072 TaxID=1122938 RepID=A0A1W1V9H4_9PAST|nr:TRAP transporter small permease [Pasteurella testudinis]SMB89644.1 TRAP-type C4-dicarboxylate transport system, small permease component [Pasteurella testudinis DSM 23072]SUB52048.1 putative TRAP transporter small permease protein [Pasteurella testudinis]
MKALIEKLFYGISLLLGLMLVVMIALVFLNVILRFFFNSGLVWSEEVSRYVFVYVIYLGAIVAMKENSHLGVDTLIKNVPEKVKLVLFVLGRLIIITVMAILVKGTYAMVIQSMTAKAAATGLPLSFVYGIGLLTGSAIILIGFLHIVDVIRNPKDIHRVVLMSESDSD